MYNSQLCITNAAIINIVIVTVVVIINIRITVILFRIIIIIIIIITNVDYITRCVVISVITTLRTSLFNHQHTAQSVFSFPGAGIMLYTGGGLAKLVTTLVRSTKLLYAKPG